MDMGERKEYDQNKLHEACKSYFSRTQGSVSFSSGPARRQRDQEIGGPRDSVFGIGPLTAISICSSPCRPEEGSGGRDGPAPEPEPRG